MPRLVSLLSGSSTRFFSILSIASFAILVLTAESCNKQDSKLSLNLLKGQKWMFSSEEVSKDTIYYRPESYNFPPSRGREGFQLKDDGKMIYHAISPTDMPMIMDATWTYVDGLFVVDIPGNQFIGDRKLQFRILELDSTRMKAVEIY